MDSYLLRNAILLVAACAMCGRLCHGQATRQVYVDGLQLAEQVGKMVEGQIEVCLLHSDKWASASLAAPSPAAAEGVRCIITEMGRLDAMLIERLRHQGVKVMELNPMQGRFENRLLYERWSQLANVLSDAFAEYSEEFQRALVREQSLLKRRSKAHMRSADAGYTRNNLGVSPPVQAFTLTSRFGGIYGSSKGPSLALGCLSSAAGKRLCL